MSEPTYSDYLTAAKVIDHLNRKLGFVDYECWRPADLEEVKNVVPDPKGLEQIDLTIAVVRDMSTRTRFPDTIGYSAEAIRDAAHQRWQVDQ